MIKTTRSTGQILAEVVVAIGLIVVVLIGMSSLMSKTTKTIRQNSTKDEAARLVEAQLGSYKSQRDQDVDNFFKNIPSGGCAWVIATTAPITCNVTPTNIMNGIILTGVTLSVKATWTESAANDSSVTLSNTLMKN